MIKIFEIFIENIYIKLPFSPNQSCNITRNLTDPGKGCLELSASFPNVFSTSLRVLKKKTVTIITAVK